MAFRSAHERRGEMYTSEQIHENHRFIISIALISFGYVWRLRLAIKSIAFLCDENMKTNVSLQTTLTVSCPTCGAASGKQCELTTGKSRSSPHRDRRLIATERALERQTTPALTFATGARREE